MPPQTVHNEIPATHYAKNNLWLLFLWIFMHCAPQAIALAPLGPPRALLGQGRWGLGMDMGRQQLDVESSGRYSEGLWTGLEYYWNRNDTTFEIRNLKSSYLFTNIGYGVRNDMDISLLVGMSDAKGDVYVLPYTGTGVPPTYYFTGGELFNMDASFKKAWGLSARSTLYEDYNVSLGAILQMTWNNPMSNPSTWIDPNDPGIYHTIYLDPKFFEIQGAIGPTINLGNFWIYGGPFIHYVNGTLNISGIWHELSLHGPIQVQHNISQQTTMGGYGGLQWNMAYNVFWHIEAQYTNNAWSVSLGGLWRIE